jgi:hypothetical protein
MSRYETTFTEQRQTTITVEVEDAPTEVDASELASLYADMGDGRYREHRAGQTVYVTITSNIDDSDTDWNDDGEWEPDDEDDDTEGRAAEGMAY